LQLSQQYCSVDPCRWGCWSATSGLHYCSL